MVPLTAVAAAKQAVRATTHGVLRTPLQRPVLAGVRWAAHRFPTAKPVTGVAFYAGEHLAAEPRVLQGTVGAAPTPTAIWLLSEDQMHRHIWFYGVHEPETTAFLRGVVKPASTVIDVGANCGYFSLLAGALTGGRPGSVHAFEPNPALLGLLERSIAAQGTGAVVAVPVALGERNGEADLYLSTSVANSGLSTMEPGVLGTDGPRARVAVRRLDGYCEEHGLAPDVVKIDVEGHELSVLRGARGLLERAVPAYVICELETARCPAGPLLEFMAGVGYRAASLGADGALGPYEDRPVQNIVFTR